MPAGCRHRDSRRYCARASRAVLGRLVLTVCRAQNGWRRGLTPTELCGLERLSFADLSSSVRPSLNDAKHRADDVADALGIKTSLASVSGRELDSRVEQLPIAGLRGADLRCALVDHHPLDRENHIAVAPLFSGARSVRPKRARHCRHANGTEYFTDSVRSGVEAAIIDLPQGQLRSVTASCRLCGSTAPLVNSHTVPKALHLDAQQQEKTGEVMRVYTDLLNYGRKSRTGDYDRIVCDECEKRFQPWDDYGINFVRTYKSGIVGRPIVSSDPARASDPAGLIIDDIDYTKLKLFVLSMLWRADASSREIRCDRARTVLRLRWLHVPDQDRQPRRSGLLTSDGLGTGETARASPAGLVTERATSYREHSCRQVTPFLPPARYLRIATMPNLRDGRKAHCA